VTAAAPSGAADLPPLNLAQVRFHYSRATGSMVARYCATFAFCASRGVDATTFARAFCRIAEADAVAILDTIGSWPSSEPELAALQRCTP
jgi:hypothetical protein